ncbi:hypothetical protein [Terricaulis sp.]|uniref:hypothetical protein n=1 Tax=Terricaulis sp. TaxID=2768686 RepID=UPI00378490A3
MRWDALSAPAEKIALAQALVQVTSRRLWGESALREGAMQTFHDRDRWRSVFPERSREAIWFISEVSDASMRAAFDAAPAAGMEQVIAERLAQNADLKPFVRRVMLFDVTHPMQALGRMQRTAGVMLACVRAPRRRVTALNLAYTLIVFVWLLDFSRSGAVTRPATRTLMRLIGL